jgi:hypothetical protein
VAAGRQFKFHLSKLSRVCCASLSRRPLLPGSSGADTISISDGRVVYVCRREIGNRQKCCATGDAAKSWLAKASGRAATKCSVHDGSSLLLSLLLRKPLSCFRASAAAAADRKETGRQRACQKRPAERHRMWAAATHDSRTLYRRASRRPNATSDRADLGRPAELCQPERASQSGRQCRLGLSAAPARRPQWPACHSLENFMPCKLSI